MSTRLPEPAANGALSSPMARDSDAGDALLGQRLDGLIGMLSHDLRTPLSAISGWIFLLESGRLDSEGQKRALAKIRGSVEEQVRLIDDTLAISRSETGRFEIEAQPFSVGEPLAIAVESARHEADGKSIALESHDIASSATVAGDAAALQRAIQLVLAHAIAATPPNGRISVTTRQHGAWLEIAIADSGAGFAAADLPWVLDPFGRPREGRRPSPRGAERGLLVAKALVVTQGGTLAVASEGPGHGAAFIIGLPLQRDGGGEQRT